MRELSIEEIQSVNGGAPEGCYYNGQVYSVGAVVNTGAYYQQCVRDIGGTYSWQPYSF